MFYPATAPDGTFTRKRAYPYNESVDLWPHLLRAFNAHAVDYLVIGAHALAFHGYTRPTRDLDIFVAPSAANADRILAALAPFIDTAGIDPATLASHDGVIVRVGAHPERVDITTVIEGVPYAEASGITGYFRGVPVRFIGYDALLRNKLAASRAKDHRDAEGLLRAQIARLTITRAVGV